VAIVHNFEDNPMSSDQPKYSDESKPALRPRRTRIIVSLLMIGLGIAPLLNALGNPRIQTLHGPDVLGLIASGLVCGFGLGLLLSKFIFRDG